MAHSERAGLRVVDKLVARHHRSAWNVGFAQNAEPLVAWAGADDRLDDVLERLPVFLRDSPWRIFEARVADEVGAIDCDRKLAPERSRCRMRRTDICRRRLRTGDKRESDRADPAARDRASSFFVTQDSAGVEREGAGEERYFDCLPCAIATAREDRSERCGRRHHAGRITGRRENQRDGIAAARPLAAGDSAARRDQVVVRIEVGVGPRLPSGGTASAIARGFIL